MNRRELIDRYFQERKKNDEHYSGYPFVTVSRQAGAGGHTVAEAILDRMQEHGYADLYRGWKIFDRELCEEVAREPDLHVSVQTLLTEEYHSQMKDFMGDLFSSQTPQFTVYKRLFELERTLASIGKVILVGRGASLITRDLRMGVRVRLMASPVVRVNRMAEAQGLELQEAKDVVARHDKERARFVKDLFNGNIDDPALYDAIWNTDQTPISEIADAVIEMVKSKGKRIGRA